MKMMQKSLLALAVMATTALNVQAASNVDVKVIGRIDPGTCTPTLSGGGTIDYGTMSPSTLAATGFTVLPEKQLDFGITCTAPSKVAVKVVNGRLGSAASLNAEGPTGFANTNPVVTLLGTTGPKSIAGLGKVGTTNIGGYALALNAAGAQADGVAVDTVLKREGAPVWAKPTTRDALLMDYAIARNVTWSEPGTLVPKAFTTLTGKLLVQAFINERSALDLSNTILLDGLSTLELVYLP